MIFISTFLLVLTTVFACNAAEDSILQHTLFLAHFNQTVQPEIARGGSQAVSSGALTVSPDAGFAFKGSSSGIQGLDLRSSKGHISFPAAGNFDQRQGTLQFFIRPDWPANGSNFARLFSLVFDPARRHQMEQEGCTGFLLLKKAGSWVLEFRNMHTWSDSKISAKIAPWKAGEWRHVALTWKEGGEKIIYIDGQKAVSGKYHKLKKDPKEILLGSPNWANSVSACYDEVRILNIPLSPEQIAADYQSLKAGREFSPAVNPAAAAGAAADPLLSHTLFLAHFDYSVRPDTAGSPEPAARGAEKITAAAGYSFKDSTALKGGLDLRTSKAHVSYPVKGNFNPRQGTVQFFFQPFWPANGSNLARIFSLVFDPARRPQMEQEGCTGFLLIKKAGSWILEFRNMYTWSDSKISGKISPWKPGEWHHITLTWKEGGEKVIYIDGQKAVSGKYHRLKKDPREFILGSPNWASSVSACYDELRILDIPLSPEQVAGEFRRLLSGRDFPAAARP